MDDAAKGLKFPLQSYKFVFGGKEGALHEVSLGEGCRQHDILDIQTSVVTFVRGSPNAILGKGVQLCYSGQNRLDIVVERMELPEHVMKSLIDANQSAFAPLIPCAKPLYFLAVNSTKSAEDGASEKSKPPELKAQLQLWYSCDSDRSKQYRVMFSETVNFFGGNWSDVTHSSQFAWNDQAACFELELKKYGVHLLSKVDQTSLEDMTKVTCFLQATGELLCQNYLRMTALISADRRKISLCAVRPSDEKCLETVCITDSHWHRQAFVRLPKAYIGGSLDFTLDIKAGWKRTRVPVKFNFHEKTYCRTTTLKDACNQLKVYWYISENGEATQEEIKVFEFSHEMASPFRRCTDSLRRSLRACEVTCELERNELDSQLHNRDISGLVSQPNSRRKCEMSEIHRRSSRLQMHGARLAGQERISLSTCRGTFVQCSSTLPPRFNPDGVLLARHLTRLEPAEDEKPKDRRRSHTPHRK